MVVASEVVVIVFVLLFAGLIATVVWVHRHPRSGRFVGFADGSRRDLRQREQDRSRYDRLEVTWVHAWLTRWSEGVVSHKNGKEVGSNHSLPWPVARASRLLNKR